MSDGIGIFWGAVDGKKTLHAFAGDAVEGYEQACSGQVFSVNTQIERGEDGRRCAKCQEVEQKVRGAVEGDSDAPDVAPDVEGAEAPVTGDEEAELEAAPDAEPIEMRSCRVGLMLSGPRVVEQSGAIIVRHQNGSALVRTHNPASRAQIELVAWPWKEGCSTPWFKV